MPGNPVIAVWLRLARLRRGLAAAAVLTALGVAGYTALHLAHPAAPVAGMQAQISNGERVSARTRAQAAPLSYQPTATPSPAQPRATGREVTAIGDSVMAASAVALDTALPGIYIDAVPSRQWPAGLAVIRRLAASDRLRPVVVVGLGTNYIVTTSELNELMRLIGPDRKLVLINTYVPDQWSKEVNATMAAFTGSHPAIALADWFATIRTRTYLLWPDHIHPRLPGTQVYARMVDRAVQSAWRSPRAGHVPDGIRERT